MIKLERMDWENALREGKNQSRQGQMMMIMGELLKERAENALKKFKKEVENGKEIKNN